MNDYVDVELSRGMEVEVTYLRETYERRDDGSYHHFDAERTDTGKVVAVPSRKFPARRDPYGDVTREAFDFDYSLGEDKATRSVDFDAGTVRQLHYRGGGDADWATYELESVTVTGVSRR